MSIFGDDLYGAVNDVPGGGWTGNYSTDQHTVWDRFAQAILDNVSSGAGSDTTAIHDDTAAEINAITGKSTPVGGDLLLIEDSAASYNKKKLTITDLLAIISHPDVPTGGIIAYGAAAAPSGYLLCDGSGVSTTTYADLFAVIGYTFGGSGGTFNLPDLRQRFPLGKAASGTGSTLGGTGGTIDHAHGGATGSHDHGGATGSHNHGGATGSHNHGGATGGPNFTRTVANGTLTVPNTSHTHTISGGTASISGDTASISGATASISTDNPPFIALNWIIKT